MFGLEFAALIGLPVALNVLAIRQYRGDNEAYLTLFLLLMIPAATSFLASFFIPETRGKYLHHSGV